MLASAVPKDWRVICSAVAGGLGTVATVIKNVSSFVEAQSLDKKLKDEEARAMETFELLKKLDGNEGEQCRAIRSHLEITLEASISRWNELSREASETRKRNPNHDLSLLQRLFLLFRPVGELEYSIHALAYLFMFAGPLLIAVMVFLFEHGYVHDNDTVADVIVLVCYGALVFRGWALAERRWRREHGPTAGLLGKVFLLIKPVNAQMRLAQISVWCCLFWVVESMEDVIFHAVQTRLHHGFVPQELFSFLLAVVGTLLCRTWIAEEWKQGHSRPDRRRWALPYLQGMPSKTKTWFISTLFCCITVLPLVFSFRLFHGDIFDVTGASVIWVFSCIASSQKLYLAQNANRASLPGPAKTMVRSAAS